MDAGECNPCPEVPTRRCQPLQHHEQKCNSHFKYRFTSNSHAKILTESSIVQVVLGAMELCCRALHTLTATTASLDVLEDVLWPGVEAKGNLEAPPPTTPKLLPSVHLFWAPLLAALQVIPTQTLFLPFLSASLSIIGWLTWSAQLA